MSSLRWLLLVWMEGTVRGTPSAKAAPTGPSSRGCGVRGSDNLCVTCPDFDIDAFLAEPLTARIATAGPTVRPVWFLWEEGAFWILTGPWARLFDRVKADPQVAIVVDVCDIASGLVRQVIARGCVEFVDFDVPRGRRKLARYLGPDEDLWDARFTQYLHDAPSQRGTTWLRLTPESLMAKDLSYSVQP